MYNVDMLDNLKYIHDRDAQDALGIAEKQWQQLQTPYDIPEITADIHNIVFAGMGGSALAALLSMSWPGYDRPFEICRNYDIPSYVDGNTLFIASSYSGNTEETLEALSKAEEKGAVIAVIANGGMLVERAKEKNYPLAVLPDTGQPRFSVLAGIKAIVSLLEKTGLISAEDAAKQINEASDFLKQSVTAWLPTVPTAQNPAKQIALEVIGKSAVIYSGPKLYPAAYKWKIGFNENAKHVAWVNQYPEFNHNEFLGWSSHPPDKPYTVIDLRSSLEHERVQKRFDVSQRLLSGQRPAPIVVNIEGRTLLDQLLWAAAFGDFVTLYTALLNGLNPTPVDLIENFKKELNA